MKWDIFYGTFAHTVAAFIYEKSAKFISKNLVGGLFTILFQSCGR